MTIEVPVPTSDRSSEVVVARSRKMGQGTRKEERQKGVDGRLEG